MSELLAEPPNSIFCSCAVQCSPRARISLSEKTAKSSITQQCIARLRWNLIRWTYGLRNYNPEWLARRRAASSFNTSIHYRHTCTCSDKTLLDKKDLPTKSLSSAKCTSWLSDIYLRTIRHGSLVMWTLIHTRTAHCYDSVRLSSVCDARLLWPYRCPLGWRWQCPHQIIPPLSLLPYYGERTRTLFDRISNRHFRRGLLSVSYTHLTLPTKRIV